MSTPAGVLLDAAAANDAERVAALLEGGADVNQADEDGLTALHYAVLRDNAELVARLLQAKAKQGAKTTAMLASIERADRRVFRPASGTFYLPKPSARIGVQRAFDKGSTPVHLAASLGSLSCLEALLKGKAKATTKDGIGATPLHLAALGGHVAVARRLLETKTNIEAATKTRKSLRFFDVGMTPLLAALESGNAELIDALLAAGAKLDATTKSGCTALFFVARGGCVPALEKVIAAGVLLSREPSTFNFPLLEAVEARHEPMVARLLELGEASETERGHQAPLRRAIERNDLSMRALLLDKGARPLPDHGLISAARGNDTCYIAAYADAGKDLDMLDSGATALMNACAKGHLATVQLLIERGADLDAGSSDSALNWAIANRNFEIVDALLEGGADPRRADSHGNTALHGAMHQRQPDYMGRMRRLLAAGANPHTANRSGATALSMAKNMDMPELIELFEAHGSEGAVDRAWRPPEVSAVLRDAPENYAWKQISNALWDELVPPSGPAGSVQGELVRCIGSLTDEAYRNGNMNWGARQREMVDLLESTLLDGTFEPEREHSLRATIAKLRHHRSPDLSGDGSPHYLVNEAVVDWCLAHRELI